MFCMKAKGKPVGPAGNAVGVRGRLKPDVTCKAIQDFYQNSLNHPTVRLFVPRRTLMKC